LLAVGTSDSNIGREKTSATRGNNNIWVLKLADTALGITSQLPEATLKLYPNPAGAELIVQATGLPNASMAEIELLNTLGQVVYHCSVPVRGSAIQQALNVDNLPNGLYTLRLRVADRILVKQLIRN
jgi:hypothetical protein